MDFLVYFVAGFILTLSLIPLARRYSRWYQMSVIVNKIPGPMTLPLIGTIWQIFGVKREDVFDLIQKNTRTYPRIYRAWFGIYPEVHLSKAENVGKILSVSKHLDKHYIYDFIRPWLGDGLLVGSGDKWFNHRRIITPTFHISILSGFCDVFGEQADILVRKLGQHAGTGAPVDITPFVAKAALDIICETAMGTKINSQDQDEIEYVKAIHDIIALSFERAFSPWLSSDYLYRKTSNGRKYYEKLNTAHKFTMDVIEERRRTRATDKHRKRDEAQTTKRRQAFLDLLLEATENGKDMTMEDVLEEVNTFMFAGHDTTSTAISFTLFCIGSYPDVQAQIVAELDSIFGDSDRAPTYQELNEMKYLDRVVKESLRLYPPVPFIGRLTSEPVEIDGYMLPKDCYLNLELHEILKDPEHFPNPKDFDPDRFLTENASGRHQLAFIPFSAGPRNCIGQKFAMLELKTMLSCILRKFKIKAADKPDDIHLMVEIVLRSRNGIKLFLEKR